MARAPYPISIPQDKPPDTVRMFVFGESAALGDPQPAFGLPRMLQAMLELRHPGTQFEVVNAAMIAINSHVILPIARDCAARRRRYLGDLHGQQRSGRTVWRGHSLRPASSAAAADSRQSGLENHAHGPID